MTKSNKLVTLVSRNSFEIAIALGVLSALLLLWLRDRDRAEIDRDIAGVVEIVEKGDIPSDFFKIDTGERVYLVEREEGEIESDWVQRALDTIAGERGGFYLCEYLTCTIGTIEVCVWCKNEEDPELCEDRLNRAVQEWCAARDCEGCND